MQHKPTQPCPALLPTYLPTSDAGFETGWPAGLEMYARPVLEQIPGLDLPGFCGLGSYDSPYYFAKQSEGYDQKISATSIKNGHSIQPLDWKAYSKI